MKNEQIIAQTTKHIRLKLEGEGSGHDWWHVYRVWKNAIHIGKQEKADLFVIELAALLHDIADWKFHDGNEDIGPQLAREWLETLSVEESVIAHVCRIIRAISFKGAGVKNTMDSTEGLIVQDADRLDAMGAIGIARTFAYGGSKHCEMYNPTVNPQLHASFEQYKNSEGTTINHFYEKLLLLKNMMNTPTAKKIAEGRHKYMQEFLQQFFLEWEGKE